MNPDKISLESLNKLFEYEKLSRDIDSINDVKTLRDIAKCYVKLYLSQHETIANFNL